MFAPPVTKAAASSTGKVALRRTSMPSADQFGDCLAQQPERAPVPGLPWDFGKVQLFPPEATAQCPASSPQLARKCAECEEEAAAGALQAKPSGSSDVAERTAPRIVHDVLRDQGQPLDRAVRAKVEPMFRHDFGAVRVHADSLAAASAKRVGALAYTVGSDIVFGAGRYAPDTTAGRRLLAHELTHVVQQRNAPAKANLLQSEIPIGDPADGFERQADAVADKFAGLGAATATTAGPAVQRQSDQAEDETDAGTEAQGEPPSGSIDLTEQLFEEDPGNPGQLPMAPDVTAGPVLQRDNDFPPPPPAYPSSYQWFNDVSGGDVDFNTLFGLTCKDGRERGFYVMWNERTNKSYPGPVEIGDPAKGCVSASIQLGTVPQDRKPIYPVGWFHTHPLANPGCHKVDVGPSDTDKKTSATTGLPGLVVDTKTPTSNCHDSGYFFFGPTTRK